MAYPLAPIRRHSWTVKRRTPEEEFASLSSAPYILKGNVILSPKGDELIMARPGVFKKIIIPEGVVKLREQAFKHCQVEVVKLPKSLTEMRGDVFASDYYAEYRVRKHSNAIHGSLYEHFPKTLIFCTGEALDKLKASLEKQVKEGKLTAVVKKELLRKVSRKMFWNEPAFIANDGAEYSADGAELLKGPKAVKVFSIPEGVTETGWGAFEDSRVEQVLFPSTLVKLGRYTFENCKALRSMRLPDTVDAVSEGAFKDCENLEEVVVPEGITKLRHSCFSHCVSLKRVSLPESLKIIETAAFQECTSLTEITLPSHVWEIGSQAFAGCKNLTEVSLPEELQNIANRAFFSCYKLKMKTLPESIRRIGREAFYSISSDEALSMQPTLRLPNLDFAEPFALSALSGFDTVEIGGTIKMIMENTFYSCPMIRELILPESLLTVDTQAFNGMDGLEVLEFRSLPKSVRKSMPLLVPMTLSCPNLKEIRIPAGSRAHFEKIFTNQKELLVEK